MAQLALPYYPSRSKEYNRIWFRVKNHSIRHIKKRTKEDIRKYNLERYYKDINLRCKKSLLRLSIVNLLGGECVRCGQRDLRCLQLDHINGGGNKDSKNRYRGTQQLYRYYLKHPLEAFKKYQILCANCNWIKRYENQESKHLYPFKQVKEI